MSQHDVTVNALMIDVNAVSMALMMMLHLVLIMVVWLFSCLVDTNLLISQFTNLPIYQSPNFPIS